jgi:(E)-4-hydroxy-3-methylbut-2-enyl-diphosphate synthase
MLSNYCASLTEYKRLKTRTVNVGSIKIGGDAPIVVQTMTTTDTMDTAATVAQCIRCIEAGAQMVRITAPSKKEAENLRAIKDALREKGYDTPLIADIHFTPNAAEIAAGIVEKVRINPGNYVDKKKFDVLEYTDEEYAAEVQRIHERFSPLVKICKANGTAMRIGTNHGSLSDRIMSRYGDTAIGMVESAMEFLRIARSHDFHEIILSMKSSNPQVMVQAYRLLVQKMQEEFQECYPLHLGVTEAGDGEDGRIKSAMGIGTLLEDGIGDTIRVSLTEDPEFEIPVCQAIIKKYMQLPETTNSALPTIENLFYSPYQYKRRNTHSVSTIGGQQVPVVIADVSKAAAVNYELLASIGYQYQEDSDKWNISDSAPDFIYTHDQLPTIALPGTLQTIVDASIWSPSLVQTYPLFSTDTFLSAPQQHPLLNFVIVDCFSNNQAINWETLQTIAQQQNVVFCLYTKQTMAMATMRYAFNVFIEKGITTPCILFAESAADNNDEHLVNFAVQTGGLLLDGFGDGLILSLHSQAYSHMQQQASLSTQGRTYQETQTIESFVNNTAFSILQASRTRISKTEYISCPSCGRTLFDLQETTAKIRAVTHHLKGVKIAIMGCIVNGPGEMADADFGYVGSGVDKISLYKNKDVVRKNIPSKDAVNELIALLKEHGAWVDPN